MIRNYKKFKSYKAKITKMRNNKNYWNNYKIIRQKIMLKKEFNNTKAKELLNLKYYV